MSLHLNWFKVYFYATTIHSLRMVAAWQRAGATENIFHGTCEKCGLISFERSIRSSLVTLKLISIRPDSGTGNISHIARMI